MIVGRILTLAGDHGLAEVAAIAIRDGRVVAAGSRADIDGLEGRHTRRIELGPDEIALPGLTDSHLHLADASLIRGQVDLGELMTLGDGLARVAQAHAVLDPAAWLLGNGWSRDRWGEWPSAAQLAAVAPGRRIALWAHDHHALWVSPEALAVAGISSTSADPAGGSIRRGEDGLPSGILHETAVALVNRHVPAPTVGAYETALPALARELVVLGVVAAHDPGLLGSGPGLDGPHRAYANLADSGRLPLRVHVSIRAEDLASAISRGQRSGNALGADPAGRARFGWLKLFADGSMGSRTAAMLQPFDDEGGLGMWVTEPAMLERLTLRAAAAGIATQIHAIGDAAVHAALDAFRPAETRGQALWPRIEHAQLVEPGDLPRFGGLGIVASIQPVHLRADAAEARRAWGSRAEEHGYAWRSLEASGATLAFGTDAPVEPIDPWPGIALAIRRRWPGWPADASEFGPGQALSLDAALRAACVGPARAEGAHDRGRLTVGQRADLIVIPAAALAEPSADDARLATTRPSLVLIDGQVALEA